MPGLNKGSKIATNYNAPERVTMDGYHQLLILHVQVTGTELRNSSAENKLIMQGDIEHAERNRIFYMRLRTLHQPIVVSCWWPHL